MTQKTTRKAAIRKAARKHQTKKPTRLLVAVSTALVALVSSTCAQALTYPTREAMCYIFHGDKLVTKELCKIDSGVATAVYWSIFSINKNRFVAYSDHKEDDPKKSDTLEFDGKHHPATWFMRDIKSGKHSNGDDASNDDTSMPCIGIEYKNMSVCTQELK